MTLGDGMPTSKARVGRTFPCPFRYSSLMTTPVAMDPPMDKRGTANLPNRLESIPMIGWAMDPLRRMVAKRQENTTDWNIVKIIN